MARLVNVATIAVVLVILWINGMKLLESLEWRFIFFPTSTISLTPSDLGADYEDIYFPTADGETLNGWFVPAPSRRKETQNRTALWFHGNGGNLSHRTPEVVALNQRLNLNVFIFDYRGYGRSTGSPTEEGVYSDSRAAISYLQSRKDLDSDHIVFLGRSLGAAVAVELAGSLPREDKPEALILISPFTNTKDMASVHNRLNPFRFIVPNRFDSLERIPHVRQPLLIVHSEHDEIVPLSQGQRLYEAAGEPKSFHLWRGAGHNDDLSLGHEELWASLEEFVAALQPQN